MTTIKEEKDQDQQPQIFFVVPCPYCSTKESSTIREIAIKKVVRHSIRKHPGRAVVAALQKAGFE
jgi:hypothetical protein